MFVKSLAYRARASYESALTNPTIATSSSGTGCVEGAYRAATPRRSVATLPPYQALRARLVSESVCGVLQYRRISREFSRARGRKRSVYRDLSRRERFLFGHTRVVFTIFLILYHFLTSSSSSSLNTVSIAFYSAINASETLHGN